MEAKLKHLEMIQGVITRMATNSFMLKGWNLSLVTALIALAAAKTSALSALVALLPCLVFWGLDGFFLRQERLFRGLYDEVRVKKPEDIDFSMKRNGKVSSWLRVCVSNTLLAFHGVVLASVLLITLIFYCAGK